MFDFKPVTLKDREWMEPLFQESAYRGCEYSFGNSYIWQKVYGTRAARREGCLILQSGKSERPLFTYPAGGGDKNACILALLKYTSEEGVPFRMRGITEEQKENMESHFPGRFLFQYNRNESDYLYTVEKLKSLSGKKLHRKRNHIARFQDNPDWGYEEITPANLEECAEMNREWCRLNECAMHKELKEEHCAVKTAFENFEELHFKGGLLRREGRVIAFTIGEPLTKDTFVVHIEKAFADIQGAYPMINQQFVLHSCEGYTYVNREEDTGDEGLRRAKLSYYPEILLDKYTAVLKTETEG